MNLCDPKNFKTVFFEWTKPLQRFFQSRGVNASESAGISQETFLRLWNNCAKVSSESLKSYLFTIGNNLMVDEFRKTKTQLKIKESVKAPVNKMDGQYAMEMKEFKGLLEEAINTMSDASKEVFLLHRFSSMTYKEIANQLEISQKAVEKRMTKALKHLAEQNILKSG